MNPYVNEEVAWQRIQDLQREMENSRLLAAGHPPAEVVALVGLGRFLARLGRSAWNLLSGPLDRKSAAVPAAQLQAGCACDEQKEVA